MSGLGLPQHQHLVTVTFRQALVCVCLCAHILADRTQSQACDSNCTVHMCRVPITPLSVKSGSQHQPHDFCQQNSRTLHELRLNHSWTRARGWQPVLTCACKALDTRTRESPAILMRCLWCSAPTQAWLFSMHSHLGRLNFRYIDCSPKWRNIPCINAYSMQMYTQNTFVRGVHTFRTRA